jgi:hypothetical protein
MRMLLAVVVLGGMAAPALAQLPPGVLKQEVRMRMFNDGRADTHLSTQGAARVDPYSRPSQEHKVIYDRMGRAEAAPPVQLKTEIVLRMQHGDNRDTSSAAQAKPNGMASKNEQGKGEFQNARLTASQREALCRQTGVCLQQKEGNDSADTK